MDSKKILKKAQAWGFKCEFDSYGKSVILPQNPQERWKLRIADQERWLLIVGNVPQMLCTPLEVATFLERRRN
ncbi:hypothetical protein HCG51_10500 [Tolypothrix sp. PCC 7910]|uniref:hypothetical protein n=1 Tax=Tolypothrix sp. PCC 7910 TaxID=2099387 RepID=UPI0014279859|nr:hypothetical protein [Tolypothrix sp. PCC 7910]QIR37117.1 hypothetical protein HCG51_10500 [Tolypothrix sp. PCC 7910]